MVNKIQAGRSISQAPFFMSQPKDIPLSNNPVLLAFDPQEQPDGTTHWHRIGAAWPHETGEGLTILLEDLPLNARIVLLEPDERDKAHMRWKAREKAIRRRRTPGSVSH